MKIRRGPFLVAALFLAAGLVALPRLVSAQEAPNPQDTPNPQETGNAQVPDPPSRVARISFLSGSVSFEPNGSDDWGNAVLNRPMTVGDRIWTDAGARAELEIGAATIHLGERTALSFLNLDDRTVQIRLAEGHVNFRVRELGSDEVYELDTPNLVFTVTQAVDFRVDVNENGDATSIASFSGEGEVMAGGQDYKLAAGERGDFRGLEQVQFTSGQAPEPDDLDRWANQRDLRAETSASARYVSPETPGYEDLDQNGSWQDVPDYGPVWYPSVYAGWAPYRYGHWVWVSPWGWTWVDDASWGFVPFHYGRWAFIGGAWGWCPGPFFARPIFAPALVGFFGGPRFGFGFGFGPPVAWFPLGFREPFFPWFRHSPAFLARINFAGAFIRDGRVLNRGVGAFNFVHARNAAAVTAVSQRAFVNGESVGRASVRVNSEMLRGARVTSLAGVGPNRFSVMGAAARGRVSVPPSAIQNRAVMSRTLAGQRPSYAARSANQAVRPPWARNSAAASGARSSLSQDRGAAGSRSMDRPASSGRAYDSRNSYGGQNRSYSSGQAQRYAAPPSRSSYASGAAPRSYSPPSRAYSAPSRSYSPPSRSYSAPSRSYSAPHSSGGSSRGSSHGGSSHGGGSRGGRR